LKENQETRGIKKKILMIFILFGLSLFPYERLSDEADLIWNSVGRFERSLKPPHKLTSLSWPEKDIIHLETEKLLSYFNASENLKEITKNRYHIF